MKIENAVLPDILPKIGGAEKREEKELSSAGVQTTFTIDSAVRKNGIFKDAVYDKPKQDAETIMEDIASQAQEKDAVTMKNEMLFAVDTTSSEDAKRIEEDGFSLVDTKIETVVTETDKIKMQLAKAGVDISIFGDGLSKEQLEELAGNEAAAIQMAQEMAAMDLPVTEDNLEESIEGLEMAKELSAPTEGTIKYMLDNELEPTIENLYKAEYSGSSSYQKPGENVAYDGLEEQITSVIEEAGLAVTEDALADGRWLIDNEIPLTPENLAYMQDLKGLELPAEEQAVMEAMARAVAEGGRPKDGVLMEGYTLAEKAEAAAQTLEEVSDASLAWLVENDMELTIANLRKAEAAAAAGSAQGGAVSAEKELALLTAHRQLEEARLAMSAQANYSLLKQGISIDTKPLVELVDALREQENSYYQQMLAQEGIPTTEENIAVYRQTTETVEALKGVPAYTLGIPEADEADLEGLYEAGKELQESLKKAGESYETMMTAPRRDMGDSIQKAFANVDDILTDLGLETSPANERAVRILAYNRLEITEESVLQMKAKDEAVQRCFRNLTPSVVREMIKEGVNPLDMSIDELNRKAVEIKTELGTEEEERFSKYLWKLDQNKAIGEEERSAFLGIYRLITQVEKTDGAAIGALMEQGSEFTMRNLLTQVRSGKHGQKEYTVDDEFGGVASAKQGLSITEQIEKGYQADCVRDVLDYLTPDKLGGLMDDEGWLDLTPEQLAQKLAGVTAEKDTADTELEQAYINEKVADLEACKKAPEEVYQMLLDCDMPSTVQNVLAAYEMLENRNDAFRKFFQNHPAAKGNQAEELAEIKQQILEKFAEAVKTPEEMAKAQEALADTAENVMKTMINESEDVTGLDIRQMKLLNTQIAIGTALIKEEKYAIPVLVGDEITNISLKIVRGKEKKGLVDITFSTDRLGQVTARFSCEQSGVRGYVAAEREETTKLLEQNAEALADNISEEGEADIRYLTAEKLNTSVLKGGDTQEQPEAGTKEYAVQTKTLYHVAESFIRLVKCLV